MENTHTECNCGSCWCGHNHKYLVKLVLMGVLIVMVFSFGMMIGELKGRLENSYDRFGGQHMMLYRSTDWNGPAPMMGTIIKGGTATDTLAPDTKK